VLTLAREHEKPFFIAESTPFGFELSGSTVGRWRQPIEPEERLLCDEERTCVWHAADALIPQGWE